MSSVRSEIPHDGERNAKRFVAAVLLVVIVVIAYFALGMPGMDHGGPDGTTNREQIDSDRIRERPSELIEPTQNWRVPM